MMLRGSTLFPLGAALLITGLMLEADATGAMTAIKRASECSADHPRLWDAYQSMATRIDRDEDR